MRYFFCILCVLFLGCSPRSPEEFQKESNRLCLEFAALLEKIQTKEQLVAQEYELKKTFESLVELIIQARLVQDESSLEWDVEVIPGSPKLKAELQRIYTLEGGRSFMERVGQEALVKLDASERLLKKRRESLSPSAH
ncbi:MAG: hypothetical protein RLZZ453_369 [Chlamydiota bacterium]|jgi:hypothetical protein